MAIPKLNYLKDHLDNKVSKGLQSLILRIVIFAALLCLALPFLAKTIVNMLGGGVIYTINYFYMEFIYMGIIVIFLLYSRHKLQEMQSYSQSWRQTLLFGYIGLVFYSFKIFLKYFVNTFFLSSSIYIVVLIEYLLAIAAAIFFGLAVFNAFAIKKFHKEIIISVVVSLCFFSFAMLLRSSWAFFSSIVGNAVMLIFRLTMRSPDIYFSDFTMGINGFSAAIGPPCSGIESMAMFTSIFLLMVIYDLNNLNKNRILPYFLIGIAGMYMMTIIRIYFLFLVGISNPDLAMSLFHTNLGWILFVVYMLLFLYFIYPMMMIAGNYSKNSKQAQSLKTSKSKDQ